MGDSKTSGPPFEPAILEVDIEEGGVPRSLDNPPPPGRPWLIVVVIAAAVAGLTYGFLLGRGDRSDPTVASSLSNTTSATSATSAVNAAPGGPFPESLEAFIRAAPGHSLGRGVTEYLNPNLFHSLAVDVEGIVWAGGPSGVVRLDPATGEFTNLTDTDGTGPLDVAALAAAPDGSVWAATTRGLSHWDGEAWSHDSRYPRSYPEDVWVAGLEVGAEGDVWLASIAWQRGDWTSAVRIHRLEEPYAGDMQTFSPGSDVGAMALAEDGTLYVLAETRLWSYDGTWHEAASLRPAWYHELEIDDTGHVWLGGENRITRWDGSDAIEVDWGAELRPNSDAYPSGPESWVRGLATGVDGDVWALIGEWDPLSGADASTLIHFDGDDYTKIRVPTESFTSAAAFEVAPDGSVWIAAGDRLVRYDGAWMSYSMDDQPPLTSGQSLAIGQAGELWVAAHDGILRNEGDEWRRFGRGDFGGLADDPEGEFWVASGTDGSIFGGLGCTAYQLVSDEWLPLPAAPNAPVFCYRVGADVDATGSLWMSPSDSGVYRWSGNEWQRLAGTYSLNDFAVGDNDEVWIVDHQGINRVIDGDRLPVLGGVSVSEIVTSDAGDVWAAGGRWSEEGGLWHYDGETWSLSRHGSTIHSLTHGPDGGAWGLEIGSDGGTNLIDLVVGHVRFVAETTLEGGLAVTTDGTVWIGGEGRLYRVDPLF